MRIDTDDFNPERREGLTPQELEFIEAAEKIGLEVAAMSDEEVAAYIKENGLEEMLEPERVDKMFRDAYALAASRKKLR